MSVAPEKSNRLSCWICSSRSAGRGGTSDPEADALASIDRETLREAMWQLPEEQRIALALADLGGLSTAEAADAIGTPRGTVLSRLHRGRRTLALLLDQRLPERKGAR